MKLIRIALVSVALLLFVSCASIHMRYEAQVKRDDGKVGTYLFQKSYTLPASWKATGMTVQQEQQVQREALEHLNSLNDHIYKVLSSKVVETEDNESKTELKF